MLLNNYFITILIFGGFSGHPVIELFDDALPTEETAF